MMDLCAYDGSPCWIMGTGFRIVTADCAIDDAALEKFTSPALAETTHFSGPRFTGQTLETAQANDLSGAAVAPVPLGGAGEYLAAALVIVAMSRALMRFADVDEALRGPESGRV